MMQSPCSQLKDSYCLQWALDKGSCWEQESFICQKFLLLKMTFWGGLLKLKQPILAPWSISVLSLQSSPHSCAWGLEWHSSLPPMATRQAECKAPSKQNNHNLTSDQILAAIPAVPMVANTTLGCWLSHAMDGQHFFFQWKSQPSSELCLSCPGQDRSGLFASCLAAWVGFTMKLQSGSSLRVIQCTTHTSGFLQDPVGSHMVSSEKDPPQLQTQHSILWSGKSISTVL